MAADPQGSDAIRVLIVDDHPVIRGVMRIAFGSIPRMSVVGECETAKEAIDTLADANPDVIVLDVDLPDRDGVGLIRDVRNRGYTGKVVVLSARTDGATVLECLRLGVEGYLDKAGGLRTIGSSVMRVAMGERLVDPALEQVAVMELGRFARTAREGSQVASSLTSRETEILRLVSQGLTVRQVANRLAISPRTVETHVAKLYRKLGVKTRVQAVARAVQLGLIDL